MVKFLPRNPPKYLFITLLFVFLALRLTMLLTAVERVSYTEELYRGSIAKSLLHGLEHPLEDYQPDVYSGGSLVEGILAAPFFYFFGPNLFSLKMVPLLFSLATLILTFGFLDRFFSRAAAIIGALLFIFSPPAFAQLSLVALGNHCESMLFSILMLIFLYEFLFAEPRRFRSLPLLGILGGFGFFYANITFLTLLTCLASWLLIRRSSFFSRDLLIFLGFFLLGLLPWFHYNATHDFLGLKFLFQIFSGSEKNRVMSGLGTAKILILTFCKGIPFSFGFKTAFAIPWRILAFAYSSAALFILIAKTPSKLVLSERAGKILPLAIYLCLFPLVQALAVGEILGDDFFISYRYWAPFHFFLMLILAVLLAEEKKRFIFVSLLCLTGFLGQGYLVFAEPVGRIFTYRGYCEGQLAQHFNSAPLVFKGDLASFEKGNFYGETEESSAQNKTWFYRGVGAKAALSWFDAEHNMKEALKKSLLNIPSPFDPDFFWGIGWFLGENFPSDPVRAKDWIQRLPVEMQPKAFEGLEIYFEWNKWAK